MLLSELQDDGGEDNNDDLQDLVGGCGRQQAVEIEPVCGPLGNRRVDPLAGELIDVSLQRRYPG
jgi:hypothetical protein